MPKNVMKLLKPSPHRQRNDFDLSHRHVYDANFGELLPATCIETVPGDNITLHASDLIRAIPFVNSPFLRAKQHLDVWFVPYHDLWHQFDAFITQKSEPVSAAFQSANYCPYTTQYDLWSSIFGPSASGITDVVGRDIKDRSPYLLQLLGYGDIKDNYGSSRATSFSVNLFRLAAYNYIWYNEYRQQYYDDGARLLLAQSPACLFNFDDLACDTQANANLKSNVGGTIYRLRAMCQMRYRCWKKDLFTGVLPSTQFGNVSTVPGSISSEVSVSGSASLSGTTGLTLKEGLYSPTGLPTTPASIPSSGFIYESQLNSSDMQNGESYRYVSEVPSVPDPDLQMNVQGYPSIMYDADQRPIVLGHNHTVSGSATISGSGTATGNVVYDVLALRKAEAVQIWRENALRAGNHIKDNMMAHYGVASDFNDHRPTYLGSVSAPLNIGDIAATANSSSGINDTVGDIAGKGLSSLDEKVFKFHAKDFGVIMVIFSMLPEAEYDAQGIERTNQLLEREDFFMPEFENLGLEAVSTINLFPRSAGVTSDAYVFGYAPRYYGYKTKIDKVFGQFVGNGIFRSWSSQRTDVATVLGSATYGSHIPLSLLYINPAVFNANFNVGISVSPQFLVDQYFDVDAVRPMSVIGLPFS